MPYEEFKTKPVATPFDISDLLILEPVETSPSATTKPGTSSDVVRTALPDSLADESRKTALENRVRFFAPKPSRDLRELPILTLTRSQGDDIIFPSPHNEPVEPKAPKIIYRKPATFKALTMNVGALPKIFRQISGSKATEPKKSFPSIKKHIDPNLYDFVSIQEVFSNYHLLADPDFPYREGPSGTRGNFLGDGLVQFSGTPLSQQARIKWNDCSGVQDRGSDCLASKGFSVSIVNIGEYEAYVYTAHFDAGTTIKDHIARKGQLYQLIDDMDERTSKRDLPVFIIGDLNMNLIPPTEQKARFHEVDDSDLYRYLRNNRHFKDAFNATHGPVDESRKKIIFGLDRILYRGTKDVQIDVESWRVPPELAATQSENDHVPIAATFKLTDARAPIQTVLRNKPQALADASLPLNGGGRF